MKGNKAIAKISIKSSSGSQAEKSNKLASSSSSSSAAGFRSMNSGEATATIANPMATSLSYDENLLLWEETVDPFSMEQTRREVSEKLTWLSFFLDATYRWCPRDWFYGNLCFAGYGNKVGLHKLMRLYSAYRHKMVGIFRYSSNYWLRTIIDELDDPAPSV